MELWHPSPRRIQKAQVTSFIAAVETRWRVTLNDIHALYEWSIQYPEKFWESVWSFCGVVASNPWRTVLEERTKMPGAKWFPGSSLNFAENLLREREDRTALIFWGEDRVRRTLTYPELRSAVAKVAAYLRSQGVLPGDRVAGIVANTPEAIIAMLATTSLGAVWSSCSPDFGLTGILDRFEQITPKILVASDGYFHRGREFDIRSKIGEVAARLPSVEGILVLPYLCEEPDVTGIPHATSLPALPDVDGGGLAFVPVPFDAPLYIMFSSGTTGKPKCIVHSVGGVLIEHLKELKLHFDLTSRDRIFYHTTCGWMMWNLLVSSLAVSATVVLYDGDPFLHAGKILWEMAEREKISIFGTSAKYLSELEKRGIAPGREFNLESLATLLSTGSPLVPESFDYIYRDIKEDLCLSSISGGTDIIGCFALGSPTLPVHRGELQVRSLGLRVEVFDNKGAPIRGEKGELVCTAPFPSMPLGFWGDPEGTRFRDAYFNRFPGVWHHGDYVELTPRHGMVFYGRSDSVLKPGGIRIGTAEIYRVVEQLPEVAESIAVAQRWNGDERVVLFVKLAGGKELDDELRERIRAALRSEASPHHVPKKIISVTDIPRTRSGKITERAVRCLIHGDTVENVEALLNPEALEYFRGRPELNEE